MTNRMLKIMKIERVIKSIADETVSYDEQAFLQDNEDFIKKNYSDNLTLCEWAGIPEEELK